MPRQSRIIIPDIPHHITQRGNYPQDVFEGEEDYALYCRWMNQYAEKYRLDVLAYCLMSNHVHFVVVPHNEESPARVFNALHMRYAQYINRRHKSRGHLWQGRFFSCFMDTEYLYRAIRYVERNPVRAGVVEKAWEHRWSSASVHTGKGTTRDQIVVNASDFAMDKRQWKEYLHAEDQQMINVLRLKTQRGLVIGNQGFVKRLEKKLQRSLACFNPGRPRKEKQ